MIPSFDHEFHLVCWLKSHRFVEGASMLAGMQPEDFESPHPAVVDGFLSKLACQASPAKFRIGIDIEQVGAMHILRSQWPTDQRRDQKPHAGGDPSIVSDGKPTAVRA